MNFKLLLSFFLVFGLFVSCKKKKKETTPPVVYNPPPPAYVSKMTAKVNGNNWTVGSSQSQGYFFSQSVYNGNPKQFVIAGRTDYNSNANSIHIGFTYTTGVVNLGSFTQYYALYFDSTGTSHTVSSGTLNITAIDTSHLKSNACDKLKANFSFTTSPFLGKTFTVNEGVIDFEAP